MFQINDMKHQEVKTNKMFKIIRTDDCSLGSKRELYQMRCFSDKIKYVYETEIFFIFRRCSLNHEAYFMLHKAQHDAKPTEKPVFVSFSVLVTSKRGFFCAAAFLTQENCFCFLI